MRAAGLLAILAIFVSQPAISDIVRRSAIPELLWGRWAANNDDCGDKSTLVISAKNTSIRESAAIFVRSAKPQTNMELSTRLVRNVPGPSRTKKI
jgi:hypothetical protein